MRIAQIAPVVESVPPAKYGGTERVIAALSNELTALGHEVTVYASGDSTVDANLVPVVDRALWKSEKPTSDLLFHLAELARVIRESDQFDIIHSHLDCLAFPFARMSKAPMVHTMHGRLDLPELRLLTDEFRDVNLVSISSSQRRPLPAANWVATVYNGTLVESAPFGRGDGGYLVFLGRISPEKGVAMAIDAAIGAGLPLKIAARMPLEHVDNPWVKQDWAYFCDEIRPRLANPLIEFVGEVDDAAKRDLLKDARALLFPIDWPEPFGLAMVEALACGTPVIARPLGSVPELIEEGRTGFMCWTVDEMIRACERIDTIDRRACRVAAETRFSHRVMAEAYLAVYRSLIGEWQTARAVEFARPADYSTERPILIPKL